MVHTYSIAYYNVFRQKARSVLCVLTKTQKKRTCVCKGMAFLCMFSQHSDSLFFYCHCSFKHCLSG